MKTLKMQKYLKPIREQRGERSGAIRNDFAPSGRVPDRVKEFAPIGIREVAGLHHSAVGKIAKNIENCEAQTVKVGDSEVVLNIDRSSANAGALPKQWSTATYRDVMKHIVEGDGVETGVRERDGRSAVYSSLDGEAGTEAIHYVDGCDFGAQHVVDGLSDCSVAASDVEDAPMAMPSPLKRNLPEKRFLVARILAFANGCVFGHGVNHGYPSYMRHLGERLYA